MRAVDVAKECGMSYGALIQAVYRGNIPGHKVYKDADGQSRGTWEVDLDAALEYVNRITRARSVHRDYRKWLGEMAEKYKISERSVQEYVKRGSVASR